MPALLSAPALQSAAGGVAYLKQVMDEFHDRVPVYDDVSSPGNHFVTYAKIPNGGAAVTINGSWTTNPHRGATSIRNVFSNTTGTNFGGFYFQNGVLPSGATAPQPNWGTEPNAGINLTGATALTFWVRGERGGEKIEFFVGGVGRNPFSGAPESPFPDSSPRSPSLGTVFTLTTSWQKLTIPLAGLDLSYVLGGFGWVANAPNNPGGAVFYLDDIQYELSAARRNERLNEPRFVRSFSTGPFQSQPDPVNAFDLQLRNTAFTYDNALAILAFLAEGSAESLRYARLIGDAFVVARQHDRTYNDGRLRSAYAAGDIALPPGWTPNGRVGTVPIPGYFDENQQRFFEIEQGAVDTGNNAWGMIALLALYRRTRNPAYLNAALAIGDFIHTFRNDTGLYRGFQGGIENPEGPAPSRRIYASTEHNLDVYAAFTTMFQLTGEPRWQADAQHAREFVLAMWDSARRVYLTGTHNPSTRNANAGQLPLDVQAWSTLALPDGLSIHPEVLPGAEANHRTMSNGFSGFDFNEDRDGVWFEGTAQMAVAYDRAGQSPLAESLRQELRRAQQTPPYGDGLGTAAASREGLTTGFGFSYFRRPHVGATAWNVFAQLDFNPFRESGFPLIHVTGADAGGGPHVKVFDPRTGALRLSFFAYSPDFTGGVRVASGDINGDGFPDIVTAPGPGGGPHVRVFNGLTGLQLPGPVGSFMAYDSAFRGGVYVATGDVTGGGIADIVTAPGVGGGPHVKVFDGTTGALVRQLFAYDMAFRGGATVAAGDVDGDDRADIVTGAGPGGGPHVKVFSGLSGLLLRERFAFEATFLGGVFVAAGDIDGVGHADVVTAPGNGGGTYIRTFRGTDLSVLRSFFASDPTLRSGSRVAVADLTGDGRAEIVSGAGAGAGSKVKVFDGATGQSVDEFNAYDPAFLGGVFVGSG